MNERIGKRVLILLMTAAVVTSSILASQDGALRRRIAERRRAADADDLSDGGSTSRLRLPKDVRVLRDIAYGIDARQRFDVYLPAQKTSGAPLIFMVHGGGWYRGDKAMPGVVENKVGHWVTKGYVFVSTNYRLVPNADPLEQAREVANAIAHAQRNARSWGADPSKFILMGHSAGSHLVALVSASPSIRAAAGVKPWLGSILLDGAGLDVPKQMEGRHFELYDRAFGNDPAFWKAASPYHALMQKIPPVLAVCSTRRADACEQANRFVSRAKRFGTHASVAPENLSHRVINTGLGDQNDYTARVDHFITSLR